MDDPAVVRKVRVRKLLKRERSPGLFGGRYRFSPYMACGHRCIYCDGRFEKYRVEGDFDRDITARINAPEILSEELPRLREPGPVCISSGISDPYQPVERELGITGKCAEVLACRSLPVVIHTKSDLLLRDSGTWELLSKKAPVTVMVSLTFTEKAEVSWLEPCASSPGSRFEMIRRCRRRGIQAGLLAMPFIPMLTDGEQQLEEFAEAAAEAGAQFAMPGLLTLREGRQKGFFFSALRGHRPDLIDPLMKLYSQADRWGSPPVSYRRKFYGKVDRVWREHGLEDLIPHSVYRGLFTLYDEVTILLRDMRTLYSRKGIDTSRLSEAAGRFSEWVGEKRRYIGRRRNLSYGTIDEYLRVMIHSGEIGELLGNHRLGEFIAGVEKGLTFDYTALELAGREN